LLFVSENSSSILESFMFGTLTLVSLPIGNPDDISLRALELLRTVNLIAAEDTRVARGLLAAHGIETPLVTYRMRADRDSVSPLVERLAGGESIALICDAGTPMIADPGMELVQRAVAEGIPVEAVPGPVAAIVALTLSGLPTHRFVFEGFPPRARADRQAFFAGLREEPRTILLYESAGYVRATLRDLAANLGPTRRVLVARDLTRPTQALYRGTLWEAVTLFEKRVRGEYTLVVEGMRDEG
jgi:16S rRNA (cytidine1402-2'-O)-methyltransferase